MREIKTRLGGHWTGVVWLIMEPLLHLGMLLLIRVVLKQNVTRAGYDGAVYLLVSLLPFVLFKNLWRQVSNAIQANHALFAYKQVKPFDTVIARAVVEIVVQILIYGLAFAVIGRLDRGPVVPDDMLEYFAVGACFIFLGVSVGLLSATLIYFVPRFSIVVSLMSMPLYMLSGVMISVQHFGPVLLPYLMWNPLLHLAELARFAFLPGYPLMVGINFAYPLKWVVALSFLSLVFYWPNRQKIVGRD